MFSLVDNIQSWENIGTPQYILGWLKYGVTIPFLSDPGKCEFSNYISNEEEESFIDSKIIDYVNKGFVSKVNEKPLCISPIGCTGKKGREKYRLITDMRYVNQFIDVPKTRYEDLACLPNVVKNGDSYVSVDLKDGFHHIVIRQDFRKYFGFKWHDHYYVWNVLNFGCSIAPHIFTKVLRPVVKYLRECNIRLILYVDDFLICGSKSSLQVDTEIVVDTLSDLGWKINLEKSILIPKSKIEYLGLILKTQDDGIPNVEGTKFKDFKDQKRY